MGKLAQRNKSESDEDYTFFFAFKAGYIKQKRI